MWVFSEFSVSTAPLAKCLNHFWVLQTQIVLDGQTNTLFLHEKPQFVSVKGTTKKADAFGLFVYPNAQPRGGNRQTAKGFCILYSFRFVVEHFESVYQLRMRVYLCTNLGVHKDQL